MRCEWSSATTTPNFIKACVKIADLYPFACFIEVGWLRRPSFTGLTPKVNWFQMYIEAPETAAPSKSFVKFKDAQYYWNGIGRY